MLESGGLNLLKYLIKSTQRREHSTEHCFRRRQGRTWETSPDCSGTNWCPARRRKARLGSVTCQYRTWSRSLPTVRASPLGGVSPDRSHDPLTLSQTPPTSHWGAGKFVRITTRGFHYWERISTINSIECPRLGFINIFFQETTERLDILSCRLSEIETRWGFYRNFVEIDCYMSQLNLYSR